MKTLIKTKLLENNKITYIECRDYELNKQPIKVILCSDKNYKTHDHIMEPYMELSLSKQKRGRITNTQKSQYYPYEYYKMVRFIWKPIIPKSFDDEYIFRDGKAIQI